MIHIIHILYMVYVVYIVYIIIYIIYTIYITYMIYMIYIVYIQTIPSFCEKNWVRVLGNLSLHVKVTVKVCKSMSVSERVASCSVCDEPIYTNTLLITYTSTITTPTIFHYNHSILLFCFECQQYRPHLTMFRCFMACVLRCRHLRLRSASQAARGEVG